MCVNPLIRSGISIFSWVKIDSSFISSLLGNDMLITEVELIEITNHYEKLWPK